LASPQGVLAHLLSLCDFREKNKKNVNLTTMARRYAEQGNNTFNSSLASIEKIENELKNDRHLKNK
jgi:hypothetical protein